MWGQCLNYLITNPGTLDISLSSEPKHVVHKMRIIIFMFSTIMITKNEAHKLSRPDQLVAITN